MQVRSKSKKFADEQFLVLYNQKLSDYAIARLLGVDSHTVSDRRKKLQLPPHYIRKRKFDDSQFLKLYRKGLSDAKIAKILGTNQITVRARRIKLGLPPHYKSWREASRGRLNKFYKSIKRSPKFYDKIKSYDALNLFRRLRSKGFPICTYKHSGTPRSFRIFYLKGQEEKAIKKIFSRFPKLKHSWIGAQIRKRLRR